MPGPLVLIYYDVSTTHSNVQRRMHFQSICARLASSARKSIYYLLVACTRMSS